MTRYAKVHLADLKNDEDDVSEDDLPFDRRKAINTLENTIGEQANELVILPYDPSWYGANGVVRRHSWVLVLIIVVLIGFSAHVEMQLGQKDAQVAALLRQVDSLKMENIIDDRQQDAYDEGLHETLNQALDETGLDKANVFHRPRLLSDNGTCYISGDLANYLADKGMSHTRGASYHPQTQGTITSRVIAAQYPAGQWNDGTRRLRTASYWMNYFLPGDLEAHIAAMSGNTTISDTMNA